jgi:hypothetical protein
LGLPGTGVYAKPVGPLRLAYGDISIAACPQCDSRDGSV